MVYKIEFRHRFKKVLFMYVCIVYNRCMYRRSVFRFGFGNYENLNESILFSVHSHDGELYICLTCDTKLRKNVFHAKQLSINLDYS